MLLRMAGRRVTSTRGLNPHVRTRLRSTATKEPTNSPVRVGWRAILGWRAMLGATLAVITYYDVDLTVTARARFLHVPEHLTPRSAFRVGFEQATERLLWRIVQVLGELSTPRMVLEPCLSGLLRKQARVALMLGPVGDHEARKDVLLRAVDVHQRLTHGFTSRYIPEFVTLFLALHLASTHVMLGELKEAAAIVDRALNDVQSRGELSEDQVLDLQVPLLRAQALIKAADGQAVEAMKMLKATLKIIEPRAQPDGSTGNRTPGASYIAGEIAKALIHGDMARVALTLGPTTELPPLSYEADIEYSDAMFLAKSATDYLLNGPKMVLRDGLSEYAQGRCGHKLHEMQLGAQAFLVYRCEHAESVISIRSMVLAATMLRMPNGGATERQVAEFVKRASELPVRVDSKLKEKHAYWGEPLVNFELGRTGQHVQVLIMHKALAEHLRAKGDVAQADAEDERALEAFAVVRERRTFHRLPERDSATSWRTLSDRIEAAIALEHAAFMHGVHQQKE